MVLEETGRPGPPSSPRSRRSKSYCHLPGSSEFSYLREGNNDRRLFKQNWVPCSFYTTKSSTTHTQVQAPGCLDSEDTVPADLSADNGRHRGSTRRSGCSANSTQLREKGKGHVKHNVTHFSPAFAFKKTLRETLIVSPASASEDRPHAPRHPSCCRQTSPAR